MGRGVVGAGVDDHPVPRCAQRGEGVECGGVDPVTGQACDAEPWHGVGGVVERIGQVVGGWLGGEAEHAGRVAGGVEQHGRRVLCAGDGEHGCDRGGTLSALGRADDGDGHDVTCRWW